MKDAWLMLLHPHSELVTREVIGHRRLRDLRDLEMFRSPLDGTNWYKSSMISLIHVSCYLQMRVNV